MTGLEWLWPAVLPWSKHSILGSSPPLLQSDTSCWPSQFPIYCGVNSPPMYGNVRYMYPTFDHAAIVKISRTGMKACPLHYGGIAIEYLYVPVMCLFILKNRPKFEKREFKEQLQQNGTKSSWNHFVCGAKVLRMSSMISMKMKRSLSLSWSKNYRLQITIDNYRWTRFQIKQNELIAWSLRRAPRATSFVVCAAIGDWFPATGHLWKIWGRKSLGMMKFPICIWGKYQKIMFQITKQILNLFILECKIVLLDLLVLVSLSALKKW